uniref:Polyprotein n=1 Tax=Riboviria sp. TaxID=2585031 RepID=A0A6M3YNK8_9VIRU|nr:MAG: hypothetical protein [Riboviria sp.]
MAFRLILESYQTDPTLKWKILNQVRKTRLIDTQHLTIRNDILYFKTTPLDTPWALIAHFLPAYHHNQTSTLSSTLFETMSHIDFFKRVKRNHQLQIVQGFTSILSALYAIFNTPTDALTWTLALGSIVTTILMILSMVSAKKAFRSVNAAMANFELHPDKISDLVTRLVKDFSTDPPGALQEPTQCVHTSHRIITEKEFKGMHGQFIIHETKDFVALEPRLHGFGNFKGCIMRDGVEELIFFPVDKNQSSSSPIGPSFTAVLSLIYVLGIAGLTKAGFTSVRELLDLSRLKNEMKTSVKDMKDFVQFIAGDLCDIDLLGDKTLLKSMNDQIIVNTTLTELKPVAFVKDQKKFFELTQAMVDTTTKLRLMTSNPELRSAQTALSNLMNTTFLKLSELKNQIVQLKTSLNTRPDVHVTFLHGGAGVGKTSVAKHIHREVSRILGIDPSVYNLNFPENMHWPAYAGQENSTYDEFGARKEKDPFIVSMNGVCSTGYFSMDGADLALKPQPCGIRHLILIGNAPRWPMMNTLKAESIKAMWSRMKTYRVDFPGMIDRYDLTGRKTDYSHLVFTEESYSGNDNDHKPSASVSISLHEIIQRAVVAYRQHSANFYATPAVMEMEAAKDKNEAQNTCHLVINVSGPTGLGKTTTYIQDICPSLSNYLRLPTVHITSVEQMTKVQGQKAIYVLDDILTNSASPETIERYCEFYGRVTTGSLIILISNMTLTHRPAIQWSNYIIPVPLPYWVKRLPINYQNNDACIRRLGLTGWVQTRDRPYYTGFEDTEIVFNSDRKNMIGRTSNQQPCGVSDTIEFIYARYCQHLSALRDFSVIHVPQIFEPDDSYVKITGFSLDELRQAVRNGGLSLMAHLGKNIKIPQEIFDKFSYSYPLEQLEFSEDADLVELGPILAKIFRRNCPEGELYIDCGDIQAITERNLLKTTLATEERMNTTVREDQCQGHHVIIVKSMDNTHGREIPIPLHEVFAWEQGDALILRQYRLLPPEIAVLRRWCQKNPCAFQKLLRDKTWRECEVGFTSLHNRLVPEAIKFLTALPVLELIASLVAVAFGAWAITRIIKSYMETQPTNQNQALGRNKAMASIKSPGEPTEPDAQNYLRKQYKGLDIQLSSETAHKFDLGAYDNAYNAWQRSSGNQMLARPIVHSAGPEDIVTQAVIKATVKCSARNGSLHGLMIYDRIGLTNAHLYGHEAVKDKNVTLEDFTFTVQHLDHTYSARIMRYQPEHDFMIFEVLEKQCPAFPDIRKYFFGYDDYRNAETYNAFMIKNREYPMMEKCDITFDRSASKYWSCETDTGVISNGLSVNFITSTNSFATQDGDCGSFYLSSGASYGRHQHARILGMHVGMRSSLYPHATIIPREILEGKSLDTNQVQLSKEYVNKMPENPYSLVGDQLYDDFVVETLSRLKEIENPFSGKNIKVFGMDPAQYVEPLRPARVPTGFTHLVEKYCNTTSGVKPTATIGQKMDLSRCVMNYHGKPDILLTQFAPYDDVLPTPDKNLLEWCIQSVMDRFENLYDPLVHPITTNVLFNGYPPGHQRHGTVNPINLQSSAGLYFLKKYNIQQKSEFFVRDDSGSLHLAATPAAQEYFSRAKSFVRALSEGKVPQTITKTCLKSELRPIEKVNIGKIRTFDAADASLVLAHREILMGAMSSIQMTTARHRGPIQIGINALSDFPIIHDRFATKPGSKLLQFDFTEFDRHLSFDLIEGAYRIALHVQDPREEHRENNARLAKALALQTTCTLRMVGNQVVMTFQGISSGFYFTSLGDSIANYVMLMYVIMKDRPRDASWFFRNIDSVILGDDISICISSEALNVLSLDAIVHNYGDFGALVTSADKQSVIAFEKLEDFSFCSRTIRRTRNGLIVPPLKKRTLLALIEWVTPSKHHEYVEQGIAYTHSTEEQIVANLNLCLTEASCHTKNFFDSIRKIAESIQRILIARRVAMRIVDKLECHQHHNFREAAIENIIHGRKVLKTFDHNQLKKESIMSIVLVEEWCAGFKHTKPTIVKHTTPEGDELSQCLVETTWGEPMMFLGQGTNKKASKADAYDQIVRYYRISKIDSVALSSFCNLKIKEDQLLKSLHYDGGNYVVLFHPNTCTTDAAYWIIKGTGSTVSEASYQAMVKLKDRYVSEDLASAMKNVSYVENGIQQMDRATAAPALPTHTVSDAGLSMTSQPAQPAVPHADITPHVMQPPMEQTPLITMAGGPVAVVQTPNILAPADMLTFGGVDFTIQDAARNQVIDHNPNIAISQASARGQIIAIDDYNPYNKNPKIAAWVGLHQRYVGGINLRYHLIANPIFMGELAICWLPDVRGYTVGDTISDSVFQLYSWKTLSLREGATEFMTLKDARQNQFYRTSDILTEDLTLTRPGIVVVIYQPMVNPFDNQQAACYLNIGSVLADDFRVANPIDTYNNLPPTGNQTAGLNSLSGNTFGTVFSEVGVLDPAEVFLSTDGVNFPSQAALTTTPSSRDGKLPAFEFPIIRQYADYTDPSGGGPALAIGDGLFPTASDMIGAMVVPTFIARGFGTGVSSILLQGSYPTGLLSSQQLLQNLSGSSWDDIVALFSDPTTTAADAVYDDVVVSGQYSYNIGSTWTAWTPNRALTVVWGEHTLLVYSSTAGFGDSFVAQIRQIAPVVTSTRTRVAYNYTLLSLPSQQQLVRFSLTSFPAITYTASQQPSTPYNDFEQRMYRFFNTITSTTGGFVQFSLFDPALANTVATIRFDHSTGFTLFNAGTTTPFSQWNGTPVNNLVFQNVQFGNRTVTFPRTDTSSWINRFNPPALFAAKRYIASAILQSYQKEKQVPHESTEEVLMGDMLNQLKIERRLRAVEYRESGKQQAAAMAAVAGAGALAGIGTSVGNYMTAQQQREFEKTMQERKFQFEASNYDKYRSIDMRMRQSLAGALSPINQYTNLRNQQTQSVITPQVGMQSLMSMRRLANNSTTTTPMNGSQTFMGRPGTPAPRIYAR